MQIALNHESVGKNPARRGIWKKQQQCGNRKYMEYFKDTDASSDIFHTPVL